MSTFYGFVKRVYTAVNPPTVQPAPESLPLKFGILGAANIAPPALIQAARSHPEAVVYAVAARSLEKAQKYAAKHKIEKVYGGPTAYQELLDDPNITAVYNPLPNGLHYEWTMKALSAGKHVLLEKPSSDTAEETREMFEYARKQGLVLLEAFHYRFHPALHRVKAILDSNELGAIKHVDVKMVLPRGIMADDDIRFNYELGGGAMMDMGCYTMNCIRYLASSDPTAVTSATPELFPSKTEAASLVDVAMSAELTLPNDVTASLYCNLRKPWRFGIIPGMPEMSFSVTCEGGELKMANFGIPTLWHSIEVTTKGANGSSKKRVEKVYKSAEGGKKGEEWWTTYRFQLEAFIDRIQGRKPETWVSAEDSVANMVWVEEVYKKAGLGSRPSSTFKLPVIDAAVA